MTITTFEIIVLVSVIISNAIISILSFIQGKKKANNAINHIDRKLSMDGNDLLKILCEEIKEIKENQKILEELKTLLMDQNGKGKDKINGT